MTLCVKTPRTNFFVLSLKLLVCFEYSLSVSRNVCKSAESSVFAVALTSSLLILLKYKNGGCQKLWAILLLVI